MGRLLFALFVVLAAACERAPATPPPARAPAPTPSVAASHVRAGTSGDYPPISVWKDDRATGFAPELVTTFAAKDKLDVSWTRFTWPNLVDDFRAGKFELAADGITVRPERSIVGRFTVPIARGGAILLVRRPAGAEGTAPLDLKAIDRAELRVVVNQGGHLERVARSLLRSAQIRAVPDNDGARAAFARGEADAAMTNTFEAPRWSTGISNVERIGPLTQDVTALWVRADRGELADRLDDWLIDEEEHGRLAELRQRWIGAGAGPRAALPVSALLAATSERLTLMPFVAASKERSGKAVEDPAQEARVIAASVAAVTNSATALRTTAPPKAAVEGFFRAQIEAAKVVQRRKKPPSAPAFRLDEDLRPAIARVSARMARLAVRVPRDTRQEDVIAEARVELAESGLEAEDMDRIATSIVALGRRE
jgi:cyclohexadienyl dehydratase